MATTTERAPAKRVREYQDINSKYTKFSSPKSRGKVVKRIHLGQSLGALFKWEEKEVAL